jgi:hypothetical protein
MRPRYIFATIGFVTVFVVILVMLTAGFIPPGPVTKISTQTGPRNVSVESAEVQVDAGASHSSTPEPLASPVTPKQDGPSLLESHCAQCHITRSLEQIKKSHAEWETTLAKMEAMGVHLNESEKVVLFEYLAVTDKP